MLNAERYRQQQLPTQMSDLSDHYVLTELSPRVSWHSPATRIVYREFLELWIRPFRGTKDIRDVRTVAVEHWLSQLCRDNKRVGFLGRSSTAFKLWSEMAEFQRKTRQDWSEAKDPKAIQDNLDVAVKARKKMNDEVNSMIRSANSTEFLEKNLG